MKITVWTVSSCIPDSRDPVIPNVFASERDAVAYLEDVMRDEWDSNAPYDDETGEAVAYPANWQEAQEIIIENDPDEMWGAWMLNSHEIEIPS